MSFVLSFMNCISTLTLCIYFDIVKIFLSLFFLSTKSLQIWNFYLDIMMSSPLHSIHGHPQLSSRSLHWSSSNLPQLSAAPTALLKSQLPTLLIKAFEHRVIDTNEFLPIINVGHIRCSVAHYKRYVESCVAIHYEQSLLLLWIVC